MKVLVTGNLGYIGSVLTAELIAKGYDVTGLDVGYYEECILGNLSASFSQIKADVRDVDITQLRGFDAIIHLAALSNDPLGELASNLTTEINYDATVRLATLAREAGIERFVYASSQSMYGISDSDAEIEEDESEKHPLTAYAKTKWDAECFITKLNSDEFTVVCFRPSTVFGASPRLRCDIVYNNLVACAFTTGKIEIKSDGTPWRPVVHVRDVCKAFMAGLVAPKKLIGGRAYNVGIPDGNFTVRDLAEAAQRAVPGCELVFTGEHGSDSRTYRVSFDRILTELQPYYAPEWNLDRGGEELVSFFKGVGLTEGLFRGTNCVRLAQINALISAGKIDSSLRLNQH